MRNSRCCPRKPNQTTAMSWDLIALHAAARVSYSPKKNSRRTRRASKSNAYSRLRSRAGTRRAREPDLTGILQSRLVKLWRLAYGFGDR
jgi:hypothetical protein